MRLAVVEALPDATHPGDAKRSKFEDVCGPHVVDVGRGPASIIQLPHLTAGFVVASGLCMVI